MRDFFDVYILSEREPFAGGLLTDAIRATFERRGTAMPANLPEALTPSFARAAGKRTQWQGFIRKNRLAQAPGDLEAVISKLAEFLGPVFAATAKGDSFRYHWPPGGPW